MITWILDQHVDRTKGAVTPFIDAARRRGHIVHGLRDSIIPKPIDITDMKVSGSTIVRGSHGFVNYIENTLHPSPGGFTHPTNFQPSTYANLIPEFCLNNDLKILEYGLFNRNNFKTDIFVKPLSDMKKFSGVIVKTNETLEQAHTKKYGKFLLPDPICKIAVSPAKEISDEWRVVVVNGFAITMSTYDSQPDTTPWFKNHNAISFANQVARVWNPMPVYVMDVANTPEGYKVVEYNQFGTSAMYACDQELIINALEEYFK